ncbi:MAG: hypothetical protein U0570_04860 [Phycisphaerales bacterium]
MQSVFAKANSCPPLAADFDTGSLDGWTTYNYGSPPGFYTSNELSVPLTGGQSGGYLRFTDALGNATGVAAPSAFWGGWSHLNGVGSISYFLRVFKVGQVSGREPLRVILQGPGGRAVWKRSDSPAAPTGWTLITVPLVAGEWTQELGTWEGTLADVRFVMIAIEFYYGDDIEGIDSIVLSAKPAPRIVSQPLSVSVCAVGAAGFTVQPTSTGPFTYAWQYEAVPGTWLDATNGSIPYSDGTLIASNVATDHLQVALNAAHGAPPIRFRCVVANSCGSVTSEPATLVPCQADFTCDNVVDDSDFVVFAAAYNVLDCADPAMAASCPADLNGDGLVDDSDFVVFVAAYNNLGCVAS